MMCVAKADTPGNAPRMVGSRGPLASGTHMAGLPTVTIFMLPIYFLRMSCRPKKVKKRLASMAVLIYLTNRSEPSGEAV